MEECASVIACGAGGISTLKVLRKILPYEDYIYFADNKNMPYGNKSRAFLAENARAIIKKVSEDYALKMAVLACNTLTGAAVKILREEFTSLPIVGMEPAYKPAGEKGGRHYASPYFGEFGGLNRKKSQVYPARGVKARVHKRNGYSKILLQGKRHEQQYRQ